MKELEQQEEGRKKSILRKCPQLETNFLLILAEFTADDPMRAGVLWTNLSRCEISLRLAKMGTPCSRNSIKKLLKKHNLGQRKACKKKSLGNHPNRNEQIENIGKMKAQYIAAGNPVISIDTKKKELIGNFSRDGKTYTQIPVETLDHDFPSTSDGKLISHGIYDIALNEGHVNLRTCLVKV